MKLLFIFLIGMSFGMWCNSPSGAKWGYKAGTWTRHNIFRLPPIKNIEDRRQ